jgi:glycosyltransferase involved in cell wall biosynthesis
MKIAIVTPEFVSEKSFDGGLANFLYRMTKSIGVYDCTADVFVCSDKKKPFIFDDINIYPVKRTFLLTIINKFLSVLTLNKFNELIELIIRAYSFKKEFKKQHKINKYDLLISPNYHFPGYFIIKDNEVPSVVRVSSYAPAWRAGTGHKNGIVESLINYFEVKITSLATQAYVPSLIVKKMYEKYEAVKLDVIETPIFIEQNKCHQTSLPKSLVNKKYFLFYGSVCKLKGLLVLLDAMKESIKTHNDIHLVIVGKECPLPDGSSVLQKYKDAGLEQNISYLGVLKHDLLYPLIEHAHAIVLPSLMDNMPNTCLEAMVHKKVVIGADGASFEQLIKDGKSGFLFPVGDWQALAETLIKVWKMPNESLIMIGEAASKSIDMLKQENAIEPLVRYFKEVVTKYHSNDRLIL